MVLAVAVPIMIQNGITNFVSLLDNIMIGRVGTEQMSGAAIVNQLLFIYNICIFGGVSGAGIFTAQFFGQKNTEGIRQTVRFKIWMGIILTAGTTLLFLTCSDTLISFYLQGEGTPESIAATLLYAKQYLTIMLFGLPAFMMVQVYSSTLRECGETVLPMKAGVAAVLTNLVLNYILIYGKFGAPALGVQGAALATIISRYVEVTIVLIGTHRHAKENPFVHGLYNTLKVPASLTKKLILKGTPLLINETLWATGTAFLTQCYSVRGLDVVAAFNITTTIQNVFNIAFIAMGDAVAIIVGQQLGAGKLKEARDTDTKLIVFTVLGSFTVGIIMFLLAPLFPELYNTTDSVKVLAIQFIRAYGIYLPIFSFIHVAYFTLRSGGKTMITFVFDSVFLWSLSVPLAFCLSRFTSLSVLGIYISVLFMDFVKSIIGGILVYKGVWIQNLVEN
ncbi:MAG: MATE family efflux transporter [Schaedlerella sp.]|nr:MATE family efflux transporter [Schaedlerella sp.]